MQRRVIYSPGREVGGGPQLAEPLARKSRKEELAPNLAWDAGES